MKLFKYLSAAREDFFELRLLRLTQPYLLNDPFECAPHIPAATSPDPSDTLVRGVQRDLSMPLEQAKDVSQRLFSLLDEKFALAQQALHPKYLSKRYGILSLTERPDSLTMWAHYAQHHEGFVVGLDTEHPFLRQLRGSNNLKDGVLRRVQYRKDRPSGDFRRLDAESRFLVKSVEWRDEGEWRAILPLQQATQVRNPEDEWPVHLLEIPVAAISDIIIGCRSRLSPGQIATYLRDVAIHRASLHRETFTLVFGTEGSP